MTRQVVFAMAPERRPIVEGGHAQPSPMIEYAVPYLPEVVDEALFLVDHARGNEPVSSFLALSCGLAAFATLLVFSGQVPDGAVRVFTLPFPFAPRFDGIPIYWDAHLATNHVRVLSSGAAVERHLRFKARERDAMLAGPPVRPPTAPTTEG